MIKIKCIQIYLHRPLKFSKFNVSSINLRYFVPKTAFSTEKDKTNNEGTISNTEPKWMRFFSVSEMIKVDIERAMKSENIDLLNNYVKNNYMTFEYEQLVTVFEKLSIASSAPRLLQEIKLRILANKHKENPKIIFMLFRSLRSLKEMEDRFNKTYILVGLSKYFKDYSHSHQAEILNFMIDDNSTKLELLEIFLQFYENKFQNFEDIVNFYESFEDPTFIEYMNLYRKLDCIMKPEAFNKIFSRELLDFLFIKVHSP